MVKVLVRSLGSSGPFKVVAFRLVGKGPVAYDRRHGLIAFPGNDVSASVRTPDEADVDPGQASPRRRQLLAEAGYTFEVDPSDVAEPDPASETSPAEYAAHLAWRKAMAVARRRKHGLILAADTVCCGRGHHPQQAARPGRRRADDPAPGRARHRRDHRALPLPGRARRVDRSRGDSVVRFRPLSDVERTTYLDSNRWEGKSGGYGVQDRDPFVSVVTGSFSNVVGLPLERLALLLKAFPEFD